MDAFYTKKLLVLDYNSFLDTIRLTTYPILYQCRLQDLNQRPTRYECVALPAELNRLIE